MGYAIEYMVGESMTIQVTGILKNPMDMISNNTTIRVIPTVNEGETLMTIPASIITGSDGSYDFQLVEGVHTIEVNFSKKYNLVGTVTITSATTTPLTLPALLNL